MFWKTRDSGALARASKDRGGGSVESSAFRLRLLSLLLLVLGCSACVPLTEDRARLLSRRRQLARYKAAHYAAIPDAVGRKDRSLLETWIRRPGILLLGDIHDDTGLHQRLRSIVESCGQVSIPVRLLLESIGIEDEDDLASWSTYALRFDELRNRIADRWPGSWMEEESIDARFYRDLLPIARRSGMRVHGLEPVPRLPLKQRDARIAATVRRIQREAKGALLVVIVGHAHLLGEGHLLDRLQGLRTLTVLPPEAGKPRRSQNLEFELLDEGLIRFVGNGATLQL